MKNRTVLFPLALIVFYFLKKSGRERLTGIMYACLFSFLLFFVLMQDENSFFYARIQVISSLDLTKIPIIKSYFDIVEIFLSNPFTILVGVGPGNFIDPITFGQSVGQGVTSEMSPLFMKYVGFLQASDIAGAWEWPGTYLFIYCFKFRTNRIAPSFYFLRHAN